ncbi:MAG: enoyl-CoA hydratase/isomerase family protein [Novosphingobium sp.]|nr:enoyl-CoA hydratase/isomerase family protein [Novosphingobium sp.]
MAAVELNRTGGCAVITLNRPEVLNAINTGLLDALDNALDQVEGSDARAVVLTGAGRAFCSGSDMKGEEGHADRTGFADARIARMHALLLRLADFPIPTIAALNGLAYGGGLELALGCTFRVAASGAKLAFPEIRLGLMPSYGGTVLLPRIIGGGRALDMMLTGASIDADEARRIGLVSIVGEDAVDEALALASRLPHSTGISQRMIRTTMMRGLHLPLAQALDHERQAALEVAQSDEIRDIAARFAAREREREK